MDRFTLAVVLKCEGQFGKLNKEEDYKMLAVSETKTQKLKAGNLSKGAMKYILQTIRVCYSFVFCWRIIPKEAKMAMIRGVCYSSRLVFLDDTALVKSQMWDLTVRCEKGLSATEFSLCSQ